MISTSGFSTTSNFRSCGALCSGELLLPKNVDRPPVVIMAHGFAAEKRFGLTPFAERFVGNGLAVFLFDYRCFGESEGEPRNLVDPFRHLEDWESALAHIKTLSEVDASRIALWGSSFSGGHVLVTASRHPEIRAVVSQVPFVSGIATFFSLDPRYLARAIAEGGLDMLRRLCGASPHCIKVVSAPEEFAAMNTPESYPGFAALIPEGTGWENRVPAGVLLKIPIYNPFLSARKVRCPTLMIAARHDSLISEGSTRKTAHRIPDHRYHVLDCGHFDPYQGEMLARVLEMETGFLCEQLASC